MDHTYLIVLSNGRFIVPKGEPYCTTLTLGNLQLFGFRLFARPWKYLFGLTGKGEREFERSDETAACQPFPPR